MIGWKSRRPRKRRAKNRRRKAKESTRKSTRAATAPATPPIAGVIVAQIQTVVASLRARETRKKSPVGITALRARDESRVTKRPPLTGTGHRVLATDRRLEITHKDGQRGEGPGVHVAAQRTRSSWRKVERERGTTAGTGRSLAAPTLAWTEVGAVREAGRTEEKSDVTVETRRGTEEAQKEGKKKQLMGGAEAERGEKKGREGEEAGARVGRRKRSTDRIK